MAAPKIQFDDQYDREQKQKNTAEIPPMVASDFSDLHHSSSPARELHQQLHQQFGVGTAIQPVDKYSGITSVSIIVGASIILWAGLIVLGLSIYG